VATGLEGGVARVNPDLARALPPSPTTDIDEPERRGPARSFPLTIEPPSGWHLLDVRELWQYRELVYFLIWRDLKVRYKQTVIGGAWAVLQPFATMVVFSVVFGRLINVPSDGVPYPVFSYAALLPWTFFATGLTRAGNSLIQDPNLLSKIYFPRLVLPLAAVSSMLVDFAVAFVILIGLMLYYGLVPGLAVLTLPLLLLLAYLTALTMSLWLSASNVKYRDITYVIPVLVQFWLFLTPVAYPSSLIPESWRLLYSLNPMTGVVEGFRWALLGTGTATGSMVFVSTGAVLLLAVTGLLYFRRMERQFADVV
jgi:lipopolysaccharide transport system permease protein